MVLPSILLATAMAVRNVCGEGGALLRSGEANLELIGNWKFSIDFRHWPSLFSSAMKFPIVWLYRSCYHRVEKMSLNIKVDLLWSKIVSLRMMKHLDRKVLEEFSQLWPGYLPPVVELASQEQDHEEFLGLLRESTGMTLVLLVVALHWKCYSVENSLHEINVTNKRSLQSWKFSSSWGWMLIAGDWLRKDLILVAVPASNATPSRYLQISRYRLIWAARTAMISMTHDHRWPTLSWSRPIEWF